MQKWQFDNKYFEKPFTAALLGSTKSGKTTFLNYLIPKIAHNFDFILFFSTNNHADVYKPIVSLPNVISYDRFFSKPVATLFSNNKMNNNEFNTLVLIDDEVNSKNNPVIKNLFSVMRNSGFSTIYSGQNYTFVSKENRNNLNYVYIFKQNNNSSMEDVYKIFLKGNLPVQYTDKRKFAQMAQDLEFVKKYTFDHNFIVLDILNDYKIYSYKVQL